MYVTLSVQGGGKLENSKIEFSNSNFELRDEKNTFEKIIGTIPSEKGITIELPIVARKDSKYNLNLLNMISQINLTGEYVDSNGNITNVNSTKRINIEWTMPEIKGEQVELSQEIITNKIYNIEGVNKRIVQILVKSNLAGNIVPVKSTELEINVPEIEEKPEQVKVTAKNTLATNGKTSIEFANLVDSKYKYIEKEGKINIEILNNVDENNNISWQKNVTDEIIVTFIYNEETQITPFTSKVKSTIKLYGESNITAQKEISMTKGNLETQGEITTLETAITEEIYKGNMYIGEETNYETKMKVFVSYPEIANEIILTDNGEKASTEKLATYYKTTKINKAKALDVLGKEGTIKIYDAENPETLIKEIKILNETEENITITYEENISRIKIETTKPVKEGYLEILNEKAIKVLNAEKIEEAIKINEETNIIVKNNNDEEIINLNKEAEANLLEPKTTIETELDKNEISSQTENTLRITTLLKTTDNSNKLFKNPMINIELPAEITEATLENASLLYDKELSIKTKEIVTNENGNKVLKIELEGEQTKYNTSTAQQGATIVTDLKIKTENFMASKNVEIKTTCINGEETIEKTKNINIISKIGMLNKNIIKIGDNVVEELNNNLVTSTIKENSEILIGTKLINNNGKKVTSANIIGTLGKGIILNSEVSTNINNINIYYSSEENAKENSNSWTNTIEDYSKIKAFKIQIDELEQAESLEFAYKIKIDEEAIKEVETFENNINVNYVLDEETKQEKITYKLINSAKEEEPGKGEVTKNDNITMSIRPKITTDTLHEGQIVTYEIKATNVGSETLNNAILSYDIPEGAIYTELTYAQGSDIQFTDNEELTSKEWNIEKIAPNETITKEVMIRIKEGATEIGGTATLKSESANAKISITNIKVEKGNLEVRLSRDLNLVYTYIDDEKIQYIVTVKNKSEKNVDNIIVDAKIPEFTTYLKDSEYNKNWSYNETNNVITGNIENLKPGETKELIFEVQINKFNNTISSGEIRNTVIVKDDKGNSYESNEYITKLLLAKWEIEQKSSSNKTLNEGEEIIYIVEIKNVGEKGECITVEDKIPKEISIEKVTSTINDEEPIEGKKIYEDNKVEVERYIGINQTLKIEIKGRVLDLPKDVKSANITNKAIICRNGEKYLESNEIVNTIVNPDWINPDNPDNPDNTEEPNNPDNPNNPNNPEEPENPGDSKTYSISGLAWLDKNKNGLRDNNEEVLQGIVAILLDNQGSPVKDKTGNVISTVTEVTGTYKFSNLEKGEYIVAFAYDTNKYTVTKYQVENAKEDENSNVIAKQIAIDSEKVLMGVTDTIKLEKADIKNIDIGLIENAKFDLSLEKYVTKVVVTNSTESVNYDFGESTLAKIEIAAKKLAGSTILVQYEIKVSNEGDIQGYANDILDYIPKELEFNSEMNPDWYLDSQGLLHNKVLEKIAIEPGKSQTVKLVLTKTLNSNSTGTIENTAEIGTATNLEEIKDIDSTPGNKLGGEDDIGSASLIISIRTGGPTLYIGIVLISLAVLGIGIYLINKKILKGGM